MAATGSHPATPSTGAAPVEATASASRHAASAAATSAAAAGPRSPRNNDAAVAQVHRTLQALVHSLGSQHQLQSQIAELEREINAALRLIPDRGRSHGSLRAHETQSPSRDLATDFSLLAPSPAAHPSARDGEVAFGLASNRPLPRLPREPVHESLSHDSRYRHGYLSSLAHDDRATTPRRSPMEAVDASQFGVAFGTNAPPRAGSRTQPPHHVWHRAYQTSTKWESYRGDSKKGLDSLKENVNSAIVLLQAEPLLHMATLDLEGCTAAPSKSRFYMPRHHPASITAIKSVLPDAVRETANTGMTVLGTPIGRREWMKKQLNDKAKHIAGKLNDMLTTGVSLQALLTAMQYVPSLINHLYTLPPSLTSGLSELLNRACKDTFVKAFFAKVNLSAPAGAEVLKVYVQYSVMCVDKAIVTEVSNQSKCTREHGLKQGEGTRQNKTEGGKWNDRGQEGKWYRSREIAPIYSRAESKAVQPRHQNHDGTQNNTREQDIFIGFYHAEKYKREESRTRKQKS
ncbi:uncharacterized protein MONBRDRAFT_11642 [Monosiga brevicollis MX1]|uniref:Uncharacterized protein n=1 Tax=Monosiga brevicollis TaxID=81824 RepID=A9V9V6_MONBE|nr:uncharacterized protein MONBRDRAFT_11642 [Monosiga brevicollis MX1]EDQ85734.1 predicted protein [Monosiga brevicollis MX1]|eukprot:XP_001749449.1 hypothetical protein [Monosiga brevicollis MX1]